MVSTRNNKLILFTSALILSASFSTLNATENLREESYARTIARRFTNHVKNELHDVVSETVQTTTAVIDAVIETTLRLPYRLTKVAFGQKLNTPLWEIDTFRVVTGLATAASAFTGMPFKGMPLNSAVVTFFGMHTLDGLKDHFKGPQKSFNKAQEAWTYSEKSKKRITPKFHKIAQNNKHLNQFDALDWLWTKGNQKDQALAKSTYRQIARNNTHPKQYEAGVRLWTLNNEEDHAIGRSALRTTALNKKHPQQVESALILLKQGNEEDKAIARSVCRPIAQDNNHTQQYSAAYTLYAYGNEEDKNIAKATYRQIARSNTHPRQYDAVVWLYSLDNEEDYALARPVLRAVAQNNSHSKQFDAAALLWDTTYEEDQNIARPVLRAVVQNNTHSRQYDATIWLWSMGTQEDKAIARPVLRTVAQTSPDSHKRYAAASFLWKDGTAEDRIIAKATFRQLAQDNNSPQQYNAAVLLWSFDSEDDDAIARPVLRAAVQNPTHLYRYKAASLLIQGSNPADHAIVRGAAESIARNDRLKAAKRQRWINLLRSSNNPEDQRLGLELKRSYFPARISSETDATMKQFNLVKLKEASPPPLADLRDEAMDLVREFTDLFRIMNVTDPRDARYIHVGAIDETYQNAPDAENSTRMQSIKNRFFGFMKTLVGQPLSGEESGGWQMYDDNKPVMINALKHIVKALKASEDPATMLLNLGVVVKGIMYCPTGQAEGINSVVNTLIHGKNVLSSDFREQVALQVSNAVNRAFINTFSENGEVHQIARARMVLEKFGVNQALTGFKERISQVDDQDIPEIYNQFFSVFTKDFLKDYLKRNIQSKTDLDKIAEKENLERFKREIIERQRLETIERGKNPRELTEIELREQMDEEAEISEAIETLDTQIRQTDIVLKQAESERPLSIANIVTWLSNRDKIVPEFEVGEHVIGNYGIHYRVNEDLTFTFTSALSDEGILKLLGDMRYFSAPPSSSSSPRLEVREGKDEMVRQH
jgi:hypothetical protein